MVKLRSLSRGEDLMRRGTDAKVYDQSGNVTTLFSVSVWSDEKGVYVEPVAYEEKGFLKWVRKMCCSTKRY
jgi:hypothetical protein